MWWSKFVKPWFLARDQTLKSQTSCTNLRARAGLDSSVEVGPFCAHESDPIKRGRADLQLGSSSATDPKANGEQTNSISRAL